MAQLEYSIDAINVLNRFYRSEILVYVEGDDDIPFWSAVFSNSGAEKVKVESAGCSEEVDKFILRIEREGAKILVARDSDYTSLSENRSTNNQVIYSRGYSIENSLYTRSIIKRISQLLHRKTAPKDEEITTWIDSLAQSIRPIFINDLANHLGGHGVIALSDNCESFMASNKSPITSKNKITARLSSIERRIPQDSRDKAETALQRNGGYSELFIRGHFFASAVLRFIREHAGKNVAYETIYASAITIFEQELGSSHPHAQYYLESTKNAIKSLRAETDELPA